MTTVCTQHALCWTRSACSSHSPWPFQVGPLISVPTVQVRPSPQRHTARGRGGAPCRAFLMRAWAQPGAGVVQLVGSAAEADPKRQWALAPRGPVLVLGPVQPMDSGGRDGFPGFPGAPLPGSEKGTLKEDSGTQSVHNKRLPPECRCEWYPPDPHGWGPCGHSPVDAADAGGC